jgi:hypothetical protein
MNDPLRPCKEKVRIMKDELRSETSFADLSHTQGQAVKLGRSFRPIRPSGRLIPGLPRHSRLVSRLVRRNFNEGGSRCSEVGLRRRRLKLPQNHVFGQNTRQIVCSYFTINALQLKNPSYHLRLIRGD